MPYLLTSLIKWTRSWERMLGDKLTYSSRETKGPDQELLQVGRTTKHSSFYNIRTCQDNDYSMHCKQTLCISCTAGLPGFCPAARSLSQQI